MTELLISPSVSIVNGQPATTSFAIAEHFGKRHGHVVRDIRRLITDLPEEEREPKFGLTFRTVAGPNNSQRQEEFFTVFFDGFILLVMGYTGKQALQIKLVYIGAFNAMRDQLSRQAPTLDTTSRLSTVADTERKALNKLVKVWAGILGGHPGETMPRCNVQVAANFGKTAVDEMTVEEVRAAIAWVQGRIDGLQMPTLPPAYAEADELECHFAAIRGHVSAIAEIEREVFRIVKDGMRPALLSVATPRRAVAIQAHSAMEKLFYSLDYGIEAAEATVRSALIASRM